MTADAFQAAGGPLLAQVDSDDTPLFYYARRGREGIMEADFLPEKGAGTSCDDGSTEPECVDYVYADLAGLLSSAVHRAGSSSTYVTSEARSKRSERRGRLDDLDVLPCRSEYAVDVKLRICVLLGARPPDAQRSARLRRRGSAVGRRLHRPRCVVTLIETPSAALLPHSLHTPLSTRLHSPGVVLSARLLGSTRVREGRSR
jgi:hypothetical protein